MALVLGGEMASRLAMQVLESNLDPYLKPTAVTMALFADVDGERVYPSIDKVAWLLGAQRSTVKAHFKKLRELGVLVALTPLTGGRNKTTLYSFRIPTALRRPGWVSPTERARIAALNRSVDEPVFSRKGLADEPLLSERGQPAIERGRFDEKGVSPTDGKGSAHRPRSGSDLGDLDQGEETQRAELPDGTQAPREHFLEMVRKINPEFAKSVERTRTD